MNSKFSLLIVAGVLVAVSVLVLVTRAPGGVPVPESPATADRLARGRYLVHQVGLCVDCHSPRDARGEWLPDRHLTGAPIPFAPAVPMPWNPTAPRLAGLPAGYSAEDMVHFLMTGERPRGLPPVLPPMPPYRLNREDAEAVVAYVRTLPAGAE